MSNPSRFDSINLLTSTGGTLFNNHCLQPEFNVMQCDIRVMEDRSPWLPDTKCIILLGQAAMHYYCPLTRANSLNEMRGSPLYVDNIPAMATYFPQDAADPRNHEQVHNTLSKEWEGGEDDEDDDNDERKDSNATNEEVKRFSHTKRSNYAFWLRADVRKCKSLIKAGLAAWPIEPSPSYYIYPTAEEVIDKLHSIKNTIIDFDIETDYEQRNLLCFAFSADDDSVFSLPILDYNYQWAYNKVPQIMGALATAFRDNTIVAHNGACFDFPVMATKYRIVIRKAIDTLMQQQRIFPNVERSLGHCTSYWTYQTFHKDSDSRAYFTQDQMMQKLRYCGKDVFTMRLIRKAQNEFAKKIPGLEASIALANRSIRPYLTTSLQGICFDNKRRKEVMTENDKLMMHYMRVINLLIGENGMNEARSAVKNAKGAFPSSNPQCIKYFHDMLGYPVVARGKEKDDGTRAPSLGKKAMYKLALQHDNPVITFVLLYRQLKTETGYLKFCPWKCDGKELTPEKWQHMIDTLQV